MGAVTVPSRAVHAVAPIRICDIGGWTDTWFAGHGRVFNIGVSPCVEVQVRTYPAGVLPDRVVLDAKNVGERYAFSPGLLPHRHPLLEATIDEIGVPNGLSAEISICSEVPAGCSTGTSAAVVVALIGALDRLAGVCRGPYEIAAAAHRIEVERVGVQSGVQDQLCAAYGGVNDIEIVDYPRATVTQLRLSLDVRRELERRVVLVYLGRAHVSSAVHDKVIGQLAREGERSAPLEDLRRTAELARDAVCAADFPALGRAMVDNTEIQARLHPDIVSADARAVIDVAKDHGAVGWKVNGAGGEGGSLTLLCGPDPRSKGALLRDLRATDAKWQIIPTRLSRRGLRVWGG